MATRAALAPNVQIAGLFLGLDERESTGKARAKLERDPRRIAGFGALGMDNAHMDEGFGIQGGESGGVHG